MLEQKHSSPKVYDKVATEKQSGKNSSSSTQGNAKPFFMPHPFPGTHVLHRKSYGHENEDALQRQGCSEDNDLVSKVLAGNGKPLDQSTQAFMSDRFGYNFNHVRIHNDTVAAKSASSINALAYTSGKNIVFNEGQYNPGTSEGKKLLAHELTHVVQQHGDVHKKIQRLSDEEFEGSHHLDEAIANGTMVADPIMGGSFTRNCHLGSWELIFRFSKAYKGVRNVQPGTRQKGVYVKIEVTRRDREGSGHCSPLRLLQTVRDTQRNSSGILETAQPTDETRRARSGSDDPQAASQGWRIDTSMSTDPFYSSLTEASAEGSDTTPAIFYEAPGHPHDATNAGKDFYTCAVCQTRAGTRWISGYINWGYYIDSNGNINFLPATPATSCGPNPFIRDALDRWESDPGNQRAYIDIVL